jgi:hypothetical protein
MIFSSLFRFILAGCLSLFLPLMVLAQTDTNSTPEKVEYIIEDIQGSNVQVLEKGSGTWDPAQEGQVLETGDEIKVGDGCEATLAMESETNVHLDANTDLKVEQIVPNETGGFFSRLMVITGKVLSDVKKSLMESHSKFEVESGGVVCGVRGTAFEVSNENGQVETATHEGEVETTANGETHLVKAGNASSFKLGRFLAMRRLRQAEIGRFQKWRKFRETVRAKRMKRIAELRSGHRKPWQRRHPVLRQLKRKKMMERFKHRRPFDRDKDEQQ